MSLFGTIGNPSTQNTNINTGGGLFGSTNTQPQQQQPSIFAQNQTSNQPSTSTFGNPNPLQAQPTQPSLFGNTNPTINTNTGGGGLFGSTNANANTGNVGGGLFGAGGNANQGTGLFGNSSNQQQPAGGGSLFGSTTQQQTGGGGGGLFGNSGQQQPATSGGLFGNTQQQQQPASSGNLFGNTQQQQQPASSGGLFGNTQQQQQPASSGNLFGNTQQQQQPVSSGGLFGNTQQQQQPTSSGNLFGQQQQPASSGGLFGNTQQQQQPASSGGLFGNTQQQQQPASSGNLFGQQQQQPASSGGLFGNTQQQQQPISSGGLFGNTQQQQQPASSGGLFGNPQQQQQPASSGGLFGSTNQQQQPAGGTFGITNSLFGGKSTLSTLGANALGQSSFGLGGSPLGTNSLLTSRSGTAPAQQLTDAQNQYVTLTEKVEAVYNAWNPSSPQCRFQHNFYNLVDPNQVGLYGRPPNVLNDSIWEKAVRENPDPTCFVPVIAIGFDNLRDRVEAQGKQAEEQQRKLKDLKARLEVLKTQHSVSNSSRIQRASAQQTQITHRLLKFVQHLHLLIPAVRSSSIRPEEELLRGKLEEIEDELRKGRMRGKLNELWALLGAVNASLERNKSGGNGEWAVVDEDGFAQITQILKEQQAGLAYLTKILQKNQKDLAIVTGTTPSGEESEPKGGESLWSSTSTLRASTLR